ncbi:MAG: hypothetical protein NTW26_04295 [bacterium]|nr:hypothetical protein [bacterium]
MSANRANRAMYPAKLIPAAILIFAVAVGNAAGAQEVAAGTSPGGGGSPIVAGLDSAESLLDEGRYAEAAGAFEGLLGRYSGLEQDLVRIRLAVAKHLSGLHKQAFEILKDVTLRYASEPAAVAGAVYRAVEDMIIVRRALEHFEPPETPEPSTDPDAPPPEHPRDSFHFDSLRDVPDLRRSVRPGDIASLDVERLPEEEFRVLSETELARLTPEDREAYQQGYERWKKEQERAARQSEQAEEYNSSAVFDLYYATYYLALLRELDPARAAELQRRIVSEVIEADLEVVAWFVNYSAVCADADQAVADAEGSAPYWGKRLLIRECARILGERFNLYLFSRFCGTGIDYYSVINYCTGKVRMSRARTVQIVPYEGNGFANPAYRAYAAMNGSLVCSLGNLLRANGCYAENWRIPYLKDFGSPEEGEGSFSAGASEFTTGLEGLDGKSPGEEGL